MTFNETLQERFAAIRLLALDADGVLTDGGVYVFEDGRQLRRFNIKDGLGLRRLMESGVQVAIISAGNAQSIQHRAAQLGIGEVHIGVQDKLATLLQICQKLRVDVSETAFMGDDLTDLTVMGKVGVACAPADAVDKVRQLAVYVAGAAGGMGAVRDLCDYIINVQEKSE